MRSYDLGNQLVFAAEFADPTTSRPADPSAVVLDLLDPHGNYTEVPCAQVAVGQYRGVYTPSIPGIWAIRWRGTGAVMAATEYQFEIRPTAFGGN